MAETNKRMEDWLALIDAETEGDLEEIEQSTTVPEIKEAIALLRELSADEEVQKEADNREKLLNDRKRIIFPVYPSSKKKVYDKV